MGVIVHDSHKIFNWLVPPHTTYWDICKNFVIYGQSSGHLWFLTSLLVTFIVAYFLISFCNYQKDSSLVFLLLVTFLLCQCVKFIGSIHGYEINLIFQKQYLFCFIIGFVFAKYESVIRLKLSTIKYLPFLILLVFCLLFYVAYSRNFRGTLLALLVFVIMLSLINIFGKLGEQLFNTDVFNFISVNLMGVYLIHDPLNYVILSIATQFEWYTNGTMIIFVYWMRFIGLFCLALLLSHLITKGTHFMRNQVKILLNR